MKNRSQGKCKVRGFLSRLLRDGRGNTFALMAAALIPLLGLIGGGIDMSRLYLTKTRLQHACDAGALAGRQAMGVNSWSTGAGGSEATALAMFDGNFQQYDYGTGTRTRAFTESNGTVNGTTTVAVPMTVMKVFGILTKSLTVDCSAKMEIPNTDVMFVLDTTGSMACPSGTTGGGCSVNSSSKITGLRSAVKCFYEALMKVNTSEVCGSDPTATTYTGTAQIRFGFVPYAVNVNVGKLLPNDYLADSWDYQSRRAVFHSAGTNTYWEIYPDDISQSDCGKFIRNESFSGFTKSATPLGGSPYDRVALSFSTASTASQGGSNGEWGWSGAPITSGSNRSCRRRVTAAVTTYSYRTFKAWTYEQVNLNVSGLKAGASTWNGTTSLPLGKTATNDTTVTWDGCIEERQTVKISDTDPDDDFATIPAGAQDLNIDSPPSVFTTGSSWGPMLDEAVWVRHEGGKDTLSSVTNSLDPASRRNSYYCPTAARKLQPWTASNFVTYVNSLKVEGNTYHDIGMIWGARLISPTGIFGTENNNLTNIQRHIIFMTDGDTQTSISDYSAYGVHWWDRRQTTYAPNTTNTNNLVNARLSALCTAIKNKNITLWVISYGGGVSSATETRLTNCATSGKYYSAADASQLMTQFKQIASAISQLRLTN